MNGLIQKIRECVVDGRHKEIEILVHEICKAGIAPGMVIQDGLIAAMNIVGRKFSTGEMFVPEMMVSAMTMKLGLNIVKPLVTGEAGESKGTVLIGTVKGDLHDIGKNIVVMMLEGTGFRVVDMGVDIDAEKAVAKVVEIRPQVLGLSALLTTTMPEMKRVIEELQVQGLREKVKVMVGGAPVNAAFSEEIGADGYGKDAIQAMALAHSFVGL